LSKAKGAVVLHVDIGGGTTKLALIDKGMIKSVAAFAVGGRLIAHDGKIGWTRVDESAQLVADELGLPTTTGALSNAMTRKKIAVRLAELAVDQIVNEPLDELGQKIALTEPLDRSLKPEIITFSGGVSEYIYNRQKAGFGDLGPKLAAAILKRVTAWGPRLERPDEGIRATVVGASQYTIQVSGSTIFVNPLDVLPIRNVPVITPDLPLEPDDLDVTAIAHAVKTALRRLDLHEGEQAVALCYRWGGSATFRRLDDFVKGLREGLAIHLGKGFPLILVGDGDIGGLVGIHCLEEQKMTNPIVSIDGINLKEFDFIDIGAMLETSGAGPVVIKSLVFPTSAALGRVEGAKV
jgi:ethanolamine utilization protein EutA